MRGFIPISTHEYEINSIFVASQGIAYLPSQVHTHTHTQNNNSNTGISLFVVTMSLFNCDSTGPDFSYT